MSDENEPLDTARQPDRQWATSAPIPMVASADRMKLSSSLVTIENTSPNQVHVVIDRFMVGHELQPGQREPDVDMVDDEIAYFVRQAKPDRFDRTTGRKLNPHPVRIHGITEKHVDEFVKSKGKVA